MKLSFARSDRAEFAESSRAPRGSFEGLDGWNPIFLKDLVAAMRGKIPAFILCVCLIADVLIALFMFGGRAGQNDPAAIGRQLMSVTGTLLVIFSVTLVPFQAFITTLLELRNQAVSDLALAGASAPLYVFGRLQFAVVEILLISSLFAPLIACAHNLGGVSVTSVVLGVGSALLLGVPFSAFAIAIAVHARFKLIGGLLPVLLLSAFWMMLAAFAGGLMVAAIVHILPSAVAVFLAPIAYSAFAALLGAYCAIIALGMPGDRWGGSFSSVSAAAVRKNVATMRTRSAKLRQKQRAMDGATSAQEPPRAP